MWAALAVPEPLGKALGFSFVSLFSFTPIERGRALSRPPIRNSRINMNMLLLTASE